MSRKPVNEFTRKFERFDINKFRNEEIYKLLRVDIELGEIFPALRYDRIDFYYEGGRAFLYDNSGFSYDPKYHEYMGEDYASLSTKNYLVDSNDKLIVFYEHLKKGVKKRHTSKEDKATERQFLSALYRSTFERKSNRTVVLDIEIWNCGRKCDLLLYNNQLQKLMFIEAKMEYNSQIVSKTTPEVIDQVREYTSWLCEEENFKKQYSNYIRFINKAFNTNLNEEIKEVCRSAKLLIFEEENRLTKIHKEKLIEELGIQNVMFATEDDRIDHIWDYLDK